MTPSVVTSFIAQHHTVLTVLDAEPSDYAVLDDESLLELARYNAAQQQLVTTTSALLAGEIARRSTPELGSSGLAQRAGHRTPKNSSVSPPAPLVEMRTPPSARVDLPPSPLHSLGSRPSARLSPLTRSPSPPPRQSESALAHPPTT